jgi:hypothetical protein
LYRSAAGVVIEKDMKRLSAWEREILRRMYGPVMVEGI